MVAVKNTAKKLWNRVVYTLRRLWAITMHHPKALFLAGIILGSFFGYTISVLMTEASYRLTNGSVQLIGQANPALSDKLKLDKSAGAYRFNPGAVTPEMTGETDPSKVAALLASQKQQTGGGAKDSQNLYSLDLPIDPSQGTKIYDTNSKTSFKLIPEFEMGAGRSESGRVVYPIDGGGQAVYTVKANGVKEDIVLQKPRGDQLSFAYKLELPKILEARLDDRGNLGIYSVDPMVSSAIAGALQNGASSTDTERLKDVQENGIKDFLTYLIPAPTIVQSGDQPQTHKAKVVYELSGDQLTVRTSGLEQLTYPISIDPSVVVTSTSDFSTGNNEGLIQFDADAISRAAPSAGSVGSWSATTNIGMARYEHATVTHNGFTYVIGGSSDATSTSVEYAPINANGTIGTWVTTTSAPVQFRLHAAVAYNNYLYVTGGSGGTKSVYYAAFNTNGTLGLWTAGSNMPNDHSEHKSVAYNGYLYVIGGSLTQYAHTDIVDYVPIKGDGTIGDWATTTKLPKTLARSGAAVYNGYVYVTGGSDTNVDHNDTFYAQLNADGTVGAWNRTTDLVQTSNGHYTVVHRGHLYILGDRSTSVVRYAPINANGTIGSWVTTNGPSNSTGYGAGWVANNGYIYRVAGMSNSSPSATVEHAKVDMTAEPVVGMNSWATTTSLGAGTGSNAAKVTTRANHGSVAYNGYIYVVGGNGASNTQSSVHYAPLNANGTVGVWATTAIMPAVRAGLKAIAVNGYMYALGGQDNNGVFQSSVYFAPINANGTLGAWASTTSLTSIRSDVGLEYHNGYMYVTGGVTTSSVKIANVEYAPVNANGTIGAWVSTTPLSTARGAHATAVYNSYMYIFGGSDGTTTPSVVHYAPINANGTIGAWSSTTTMSDKRLYMHARIYQGHVFIAGGWDGGSIEHNTVTYAKFNADGTIGTWKTGTSFTTGREGHGYEIHNGYMYITGGWNGTTKYGDVQYAQLTSTLPASSRGTINASASTSGFTTAREMHESIAYNGYLYVIGGYGGATLADVQYAPINANGTIGAWAATTSLPEVREAFVAVVYNGYLYAIGGYTGSSTLADVHYAPINANGTIGAWTATTSFATARSEHAAVAYAGNLYVIGGFSPLSGALADVQYAPINANGTIGAWTATTSFATARYEHVAVAYNGYLYITAGNSSGSTLSGVQYAPINANGTIGAWTATTGVTTARYDHTFAAYAGYLYVMGGYNSTGTALADVQYAPINANGTIGAWTATTALATGRATHASIIYNGYLYAVGGYTGTITNDVTYAQLNVIPLAAQYTKIVNLGQPSSLNGVTLNGSYAVGQRVVSIKVAGADGVFGGWQSTDGLSVAPIANVQYVMFKLSIDDGLGLASLGVSGGRSIINDVTMDYTIPAALTPENRLRQNKFFDASGVLQPLQTQ